MRIRSADDGRFHLIFNTESEQFSLFDMRTDRLEQHDLFAPDHPELSGLMAGLDRWLEITDQRSKLDPNGNADTRKEEELRALGYLE